MTTDPAMMSATELVTRFRQRSLSPVEATQAALARIERHDPTLKAFVFLDAESALSAARESESRWFRGRPLGLVDGVPTTIKDMFLTKGWPTRRGSRTIPVEGPWDEDSPLVERLREQGAVFLGKTAQSEFGWKGVGSPLHGITRNPWDPRLTPGGSSGGAAVAAALGMGALHAGGDGGGSIRIPASFTGIYGIKPSLGRVPNYPSKNPGSITHAGPMTRTVSDAALMLTVMSGPDARDWRALPYEGVDYRHGLDGGVAGLKVAFSPTLGFAKVNSEVAALVRRSAVAFADLGADVEEADPMIGDPQPAFYAYYAIRFTRLCDMLSESQLSLLDPGILAMAEDGRRFTSIDILNAEAYREELGYRMSLFHSRYDLLLTPTMPIPAFVAGEDFPRGGGYDGWMDWSPFTYPFNFTQQPAASVPCGFTAAGLPVGLQIVGGRYRDDIVLKASWAFEQAHPFVMPEEPNG